MFQIYSALLVFVTQKLSMRRGLQKDQMLTASHDNVTAWAGIGAAVIQLWHQRTAPARASILDVLSAALYLSTIVGLHITTSSLFSLGASSSLRTSLAGTRGLPAFNSIPDRFAV